MEEIMKTLTTLTAVAALIAGISIASAQSSMDKGSTMGSSTASVTGTGKFCIKGSSGALNCEFASLALCQKSVKGSESCQARPSSTTGSKY
jgi:hypothetical protein